MKWLSIVNVLLLVLVAVTNNSSTATTECNLQVKECPSVVKGLRIESLTIIPGCCEWPCDLHRNSTALIIIDFHTDVSYSMVEQQMFTEIDGIRIPTQQLLTNVCEVISCPLKAGNHYQITEKIVIPEEVPAIVALTDLVFYDGNRTSIGCLSMDIRTI